MLFLCWWYASNHQLSFLYISTFDIYLLRYGRLHIRIFGLGRRKMCRLGSVLNEAPVALYLPPASLHHVTRFVYVGTSLLGGDYHMWNCV